MVKRKIHPNKEVEAAIRYAESADWAFIAAGKSAHAFGTLRCPHKDPSCRNGQFCANSIWSTPRNPYAHARAIYRWVDNCQHLKHKERTDR